MEIGQNNIRVGIAKFGSRSYNEFNLNRFDNKTDLMRAIDNIGYNPDGGADFTAAIGYMRNNMFSVSCQEDVRERQNERKRVSERRKFGIRERERERERKRERERVRDRQTD